MGRHGSKSLMGCLVCALPQSLGGGGARAPDVSLSHSITRGREKWRRVCLCCVGIVGAVGGKHGEAGLRAPKKKNEK